MKLKTLVIGGSGLFLMVFSLLLFVAILFSDEQDSGISNIHYGGVNVSAEVLAHKPMVEKYAKEYGVEEYVNILLAIIQVESGGTAEDVMQSSESLGLPPNSLSTEESIKHTIGKTLEESFSILTGVTDAETLAVYKQEYTREADIHMTANTRFFPETKQVLTALKETGAKVGIISSKYRYRINELVCQHFPEGFFDIIVGGEDV